MANRRKRNRSIFRREHNVNPASPWRRESFGHRRGRQTLSSSFSPPPPPPLSLSLSSLSSDFVNYIPRALNVARSSTIIAVRSYSRASCISVHIYYERCFTLHITYSIHFPLAISQICKILRRRKRRGSRAQTTRAYVIRFVSARAIRFTRKEMKLFSRTSHAILQIIMEDVPRGFSKVQRIHIITCYVILRRIIYSYFLTKHLIWKRYNFSPWRLKFFYSRWERHKRSVADNIDRENVSFPCFVRKLINRSRKLADIGNVYFSWNSAFLSRIRIFSYRVLYYLQNPIIC